MSLVSGHSVIMRPWKGTRGAQPVNFHKFVISFPRTFSASFAFARLSLSFVFFIRFLTVQVVRSRSTRLVSPVRHYPLHGPHTRPSPTGSRSRATTEAPRAGNQNISVHGTTSRARLYSFLTSRTRRVRSSLPRGLGAIPPSGSFVTPRRPR